MKAILVRIGVDHAYGGWNGPIDPDTGEFLYIPIPEKEGTLFHAGCERRYSELAPLLEGLCSRHHVDLAHDLKCPIKLLKRSMHLDPDFQCLTYGDVGNRRGSEISQLMKGDLLVFYAGLRPIRSCDHKLIYAIVGLFVVDKVLLATHVPKARWGENAHTRKKMRGPSDIVVRAAPGQSGRLMRALPIGEYRDRAYRVRHDLIKAWGGLSVLDGYIQRSARPPRFLDAARFHRWFIKQSGPLIQVNNPPLPQRVVIVHLRRPVKSDPNEMRSDPFWEFGSFGCTGCHRRNLMNLRRIHELEGVRLAFAQGGPAGFRLLMLTPPVRIVCHRSTGELIWLSTLSPFRYDCAPVIVDAKGASDFPGLRSLIEQGKRSTWAGRFSSHFRSRRKCLPAKIADEVCQVFDARYREAEAGEIAQRYDQALPYPPNKIDRARRATYERMIRKSNRGPCHERGAC